MNHFEKCIICESEILALQGYEQHHLVKCTSCKFIFCKPKPTLAELEAHYGLYPRANAISEITIKRYNELLDTFEKYRKTNNIIDVGCGDGHFLAEAAKRGWKVFGTEFTDEAIAVCSQKKISMAKGPIRAESYHADFFDIVTSFEVIEHINNPVEEAQIYKTILRSGGVLYITTPNFDSVSRLILRSKWSCIEYPEHLSYYTKGTLKELLTRNGFKSKQVSTTGISVSRFKQATNNNAPTGNQDDEAFAGKS